MLSTRPLYRAAAAVAACSVASLPALASEDIFYSQSSLVMTLEPAGSPQNFLPVCFSEVRAMAHIGTMLYVIDAWGGLMSADIFVPAGIQMQALGFTGVAIAVHDGQLLVAGDDGTIQRYDPDTLQLLSSFNAGSPIRDMALDGETLWLAGPDGSVLRGDATTGNFTLAGICAGEIDSLLVAEGDVFLGSSFGTVFILDGETGLIAYAYQSPNDAISMARDGQTLLIGGSDGSIHRYVLGDSTLIESFQTFFAVEALLHYDNPQQLDLDVVVQENSLVTGVEATLSLDAGPEHASSLFFVLGSMSSTWPGFVVDGLLVPVNPDAYFWMTVQGGMGILNGGIGILPPDGKATATFSLPGGVTNATFLNFGHTAVTFDLGTSTLSGVAPPVNFWALN